MRFSPLLAAVFMFNQPLAHGQEAVATVHAVTGKVFVKGDNGAFYALQERFPVTAGQKIAPLDGTALTLRFATFTLDVPPQAEVTPLSATGLSLLRGTLRLRMDSPLPAPLILRTPVATLTAEAGTAGTVLLQVRPEGTTAAHTTHCCLTLTTEAASLTLNADQFSAVTSALEAPAAVAAAAPWVQQAQGLFTPSAAGAPHAAPQPKKPSENQK
jgi:hypothetical protein